MAMSPVPLFPHLGPQPRPFLLDARQAAAGSCPALVRLHVGQVAPDAVPVTDAIPAAVAGIAWGESSPGTGVSHLDMLCSSRASYRRSGCPRRSLGRGARGRLDDVLDAPDVLRVQGGVVDLLQRAGNLAGQLLL